MPGAVAYGQEGLYGSSAPEDASMVRVISAATGDESITIDVGPVRFPDIEPRTGTPYRPVQPEIYLLFSRTSREIFSPERAQFYTIITTGDRVLVFHEDRHTDPARAQIVFYNLTGASGGLDAVVPEATLVEPVAPDGSAVRVINAIPVTLAATGADGRTVSDGIDITLERGASYGVVAITTADGTVELFIVEASVSAE